MAEQQIPQQGAWTTGAQWGTGNLAQTNYQDVCTFTNNSGATRKAGDVVVLQLASADTTGAQAITSTTLNDKSVIGVVAPATGSAAVTDGSTYANGAEMPVLVEGIGRINIAANTVAIGDSLCQSTVAGVAITSTLAPVANVGIGTIIAVAMQANGSKDANNTILAIIKKM